MGGYLEAWHCITSHQIRHKLYTVPTTCSTHNINSSLRCLFIFSRRRSPFFLCVQLLSCSLVKAVVLLRICFSPVTIRMGSLVCCGVGVAGDGNGGGRHRSSTAVNTLFIFPTIVEEPFALCCRVERQVVVTVLYTCECLPPPPPPPPPSQAGQPTQNMTRMQFY